MARVMQRIEAAGGVLWRAADARLGVEVALVHRRGHDGWSLPKGKLLPGEPTLLGALREVREETGHQARVGPSLGSVEYLKNGGSKRVRYWSLAVRSGEFSPSKEIDDLIWLPPDAATRLARERDRPVLGRFWATRADLTRPLLLVRPGSVVSRSDWSGRDEDRPLDPRGRQQAIALADLLRAFGVRRAITADERCCAETLQPLERLGEVTREHVLPAEAGRATVRAAAHTVFALARDGVPTAVCAKRRLLGRLSQEISSANGQRLSGPADVPPGSVCVLHVQPSGRRPISREQVSIAG